MEQEDADKVPTSLVMQLAFYTREFAGFRKAGRDSGTGSEILSVKLVNSYRVPWEIIEDVDLFV
jgi:hypothetical protein